MTQNITVKIYDREDSPEEPPSDLAEYIAWLTAKLAEVPEQFRSTARTEISAESSYDWGVLIYRIECTRPETAEETAARESLYKAAADWKRQRDLQTLAALQAKYGANGSHEPCPTKTKE